MGYFPERPEPDTSALPEQCQNCGILAGRISTWSIFRTGVERKYNSTWNPFEKAAMLFVARWSDRKMQRDIDKMGLEATEAGCDGTVYGEVCGRTFSHVVNEDIDDEIQRLLERHVDM